MGCANLLSGPNSNHRLQTLGMFRNEKAAQRVSFGAGYPVDIHADIPADVRGQKLRSALEILEKQAFRCGHPWPEGADVHDPKGGERKLRSEKLQAEFSFPWYVCLCAFARCQAPLPALDFCHLGPLLPPRSAERELLYDSYYLATLTLFSLLRGLPFCF